MVSASELEDDQEFEDIKDDVHSECSSHGAVSAVLIPRAKEGFPQACEGSIFVEFRDASMARNAALALSGRKFGERVVSVEYVCKHVVADVFISHTDLGMISCLV